MIDRFALLRNIGIFNSVDAGATIPLARLTLVYAENGRGKTTLAAILRSLATGNPIPIAERRRLAAQHPPHIVLPCIGGPAMFQNNAWNRTLPNLVVFDDVFIDQNIHSGLAVAAGHRQNLHELILGAQAVALNRQLQELIARVELHNTALREKANAIPAAERGGLSVDDFCALAPRLDIDAVIDTAERNLAAAREQEPVRLTPLFETMSLPSFDIAAINTVLEGGLPFLEATAAEQVQRHLRDLGPGGEIWADEGMSRMPQPAAETGISNCPFCAQDLSGSPVINHYRAYFSAGYESLKRRILETRGQVDQTHGEGHLAAFERAVRVSVERRHFWAQFAEMPDTTIDTAVIVRDWQSARQAVFAALAIKQSAPLEHIELGQDARAALMRYEDHRVTIAALSSALQQANAAIRIVKEQAATINPAAIAADLSRYRAVKARHSVLIAALCNAYLTEKNDKTATEQRRDQTRVALDTYRTTVFAGYQTAVNLYLQRFNAGFRLDSVTSANTRGGLACTYNVIINNTSVAVGSDVSTGEPSFRNTLSSGDRNTLALGFFFASLDQDPALRDKIIVIDDPISSLDDHRSLTTIQEIRRLVSRAGQVVVLSHNKPFLCNIWDGTDHTMRAALQIVRDGQVSTIRPWDVDQDSVTEHDRRHAVLRDCLAGGSPNNREVATAIRPMLEAFLRVACPEHFPPGMLLGPFLNTCEQRAGTSAQILNLQVVRGLGDLIEYANKFHHDTNAAWETEQINDGELQGFVRQALDFVKP